MTLDKGGHNSKNKKKDWFLHGLVFVYGEVFKADPGTLSNLRWSSW